MQKASMTNRWWESYLVRYLLPSLAGMVFINIIIELNPDLYNKLFPMNIHPTQNAGVILLFIYGNLFCYFSGYPILVFHATRIVDHRNNNYLKYFTELVFLAFLFFLLCGKFIEYIWWNNTLPWFSVVFIVMCTLFQFIRLMHSYNNVPTLMHEYVKDLDEKRGLDKYYGVMETYKHLREHGNTAIMFLFEVSVFVSFIELLTYVNGYLFLGMFVSAYVLPAAIVHYSGQLLEKDFSDIKRWPWV